MNKDMKENICPNIQNTGNHEMQILQLQSLPFQDCNKFLNCPKFPCDLICSGRSFHNTAALYLNDCFPNFSVLTLGTSKIFEYLKLYFVFLNWTKSFKQGGAILYNILKVSNAIVRILLI